MTDEDLDQRLAELEAALGTPEAKGLSPVAGHDQKKLPVEYINLHGEANARHRDRLATLAYEPPKWVIDTLGERPVDPDRRAVWDAVVDRALRYRTEQRIPDEAPELLGPIPPSRDVEQRVVWMTAHRDARRDLTKLTTEHKGLALVRR